MKKLMFAAAVVGAMVMSAEAGYSITLKGGGIPSLSPDVSELAKNAVTEKTYISAAYMVYGTWTQIVNDKFIEDSFTEAFQSNGDFESTMDSLVSAGKAKNWEKLNADYRENGQKLTSEWQYGLLLGFLTDNNNDQWVCVYHTNFLREGDDASEYAAWWSFANGTDDGHMWEATVNTPGGTGWITTAVPEPTSVLLMLLGMAGLALKRKVA